MIILFLPAAACFFWIVLNFFLARRTSNFWLLTFLSIVLMMYLVADAIYVTPGRPTTYVVYSHMMSIIAGPSILPLLIMYFSRLNSRKSFRPHHYLWVLIPISLFSATLSLSGYMGTEAVANFLERLYEEGPRVALEYKGQQEWIYFLWASAGYRVVVGLELIFFLGYYVGQIIKQKDILRKLWRYLHRGESIRVVELSLSTMFLAALYIISKVFFFKDIFDAHPLVAALQAFLVISWYFFFMLCALLGEKETITRIQAQHTLFYNYNPSIKGPIIEIMMEELLEEAGQDALLRFQKKIGDTLQMDNVSPAEISTVKEKMYSSASGSWDDSLLARFRSLMVNEQMFLQPSLSLNDIADRLHTNKTYVSKLVNNTYNLSFPELLNTLRIDYAKQYLLNHKDATQAEVAKACGFSSASSFNNIFRKITGMTPKVWLATEKKKKTK